MPQELQNVPFSTITVEELVHFGQAAPAFLRVRKK
jgi:hypothetical protein